LAVYLDPLTGKDPCDPVYECGSSRVVEACASNILNVKDAENLYKTGC